ncbi:hypothetical protein ADZ37_10585 [Pannonibacter phragmitetus]|uniref:hypothetical protein n=2 Tax=Stappiaceae TaxID=2821832 RepID=UPI00067ABD95|nr:hypothetical protein [Pannonibacter phragmitetus]KND19417.1 hypothetical protein ADZ37_10585 [Pannonibacter phragmitetus]
MKMQGPDGSELIEVLDVQPHENGLLLSGQIMGAMPMKAVLRPSQLRAGLRFVSVRLVFRLIAMLFRRDG